MWNTFQVSKSTTSDTIMAMVPHKGASPVIISSLQLTFCYCIHWWMQSSSTAISNVLESALCMIINVDVKSSSCLPSTFDFTRSFWNLATWPVHLRLVSFTFRRMSLTFVWFLIVVFIIFSQSDLCSIRPFSYRCLVLDI